jgi:hypothetical protein
MHPLTEQLSLRMGLGKSTIKLDTTFSVHLEGKPGDSVLVEMLRQDSVTFRMVMRPIATFFYLIGEAQPKYCDISRVPAFEGSNAFGERYTDPEQGRLRRVITYVIDTFSQGLVTADDLKAFQESPLLKGYVYYMKMALVRAMSFLTTGTQVAEEGAEWEWREIEAYLNAAEVYVVELWYQELQRETTSRRTSRLHALRSFSQSNQSMYSTPRFSSS